MTTGNARPHPSPLPRGAGTAVGCLGRCNGRSTNPVAGCLKRRRMILPLPGGEGWGEGERSKSVFNSGKSKEHE